MIIERESGDIISEIKMSLSVNPHTVFWLVEGVTDIRFFRPRLMPGIELVDCNGKYKLINTINTMNSIPALQPISAMGIVDNDYDWLTGFKVPANVISTEPRDLEGILLRANAVDCVLAEFANKDNVQNFITAEGSVIDAICRRALVFGKIRAVNGVGARACLKKFKPIQFAKKDWSYDEDSAYAKAVELGVATTVDALRQAISNLPNVQPWYYVRGHDAVDILVSGLIHIFGAPNIRTAKVEPVLRQSFSSEQYRQTSLHVESEKWHASRSLEYPYKP